LEDLLYTVFIVHIVQQSPAEDPPHNFKQHGVEVTPFINALGGSTEGALKSEAVDQAKLAPHDHTSSCFLTLMDRKVTIFKTKILIVLSKEPL
jgi:hypothetical protein